MYSVSISVVSHNQIDIIKDLLSDIKTFYNKKYNLEILLTINTQEEKICLDDFCELNIKIIKNHSPKGFGENHNYACDVSLGDLFFVVNPDIRLKNDVFFDISENLTKNNRCLYYPKVINSQGILEDSVRKNLTIFSLLGRVFNKKRITVDDGVIEFPGQFRWVAGMFFGVSKSFYRNVGGFDEKFFLYCEDYDLCARVFVSGGRIFYDESLVVIHDARRSSKKSVKYLRMHLASLLKVWFSVPFWRIVFHDLKIG